MDPVCVCGHTRDEHGNDGAGHCGATKECRSRGGCREFRLADDTVAVGPVYLAGPITATAARSVAENIASAASTLRYLTDRRVAAVCPQLTAAVPMLDEVAYEDWMSVDFLLLRSCRAVLVLPGWDQSAGTRREIAHATDHGVPVFFAVRPLFDFLGVSARAARPLGATPNLWR
jgi:hypothetical protein